jgi:hypothetical protein
MISDNFWKILFILMLLTGLGFWYKSSTERKAFKITTSQLADLVSFTEETLPRNDEEAHQRFIRAVSLVYEAEQQGTERARQLLDATFDYNEISKDGAKANLIRNAILDSVSSCRKLGVFNEESYWDLQDGQAVEITEGPYTGEKITVTHRVPPSIAPGARLFLGNFLIVPESIAAVSRDVELTQDVVYTSTKLANAEIISDAEALLIKQNRPQHNAKNR